MVSFLFHDNNFSNKCINDASLFSWKMLPFTQYHFHFSFNRQIKTSWSSPSTEWVQTFHCLQKWMYKDQRCLQHGGSWSVSECFYWTPCLLQECRRLLVHYHLSFAVSLVPMSLSSARLFLSISEYFHASISLSYPACSMGLYQYVVGQPSWSCHTFRPLQFACTC